MITPVLLCGGNGRRLWPLVDECQPKHLVSLVSEKPMLVETALRFSDGRYRHPIVVCNQKHLSETKETLARFRIDNYTVIAEKDSKDTCIAVALAARFAANEYGDINLLICPIDHFIPDFGSFHQAITDGVEYAINGNIVTFGIKPDYGSTAYGYIEVADQISEKNALPIIGFEEKPQAKLANNIHRDGRHFWNSGMFLASAHTLLEELELHASDVAQAVDASLKNCSLKHSILSPDPEHLGSLNAASFDYEVMRKTTRSVVVPVVAKWSDLGNWNAVWNASSANNLANVCQGNVYLSSSQGCLAYSQSDVLTLIGLKDVIAVAHDNRILVCSKTAAEKLGKHRLDTKDFTPPGVSETKSPDCISKPWGSFTVLERGERHLTKRLDILPGGATSMQFHNHRSEHWVIVEGAATVTLNEDEFILTKDQSAYVPATFIHRIENRSTENLSMIEVQLGDVLSEEDIVRLEDKYGRLTGDGR